MAELTISQFARLGGKARAAKLGPEQCAAIARKAGNARWAKERKRKRAKA